MARIRTIKPEFPQSESMGKVSRDARLLFILLWTICDDSGRTRAASRMLASLLYPYDDDAAEKIEGWLDELEKEGCIVRYVVNGSHYLQVIKWSDHQKIDKPSPSKLPSPRESSRILANPRERSSEDQGREGKGKEQEGSVRETKPDPDPPVDNSAGQKKEPDRQETKKPPVPRWTESQSADLDDLMGNILDRHGFAYHGRVQNFIRANYTRRNPEAVLHCLRRMTSDLEAGKKIPTPERWLEAALNGNGKHPGENGAYEARESERRAEEYKGPTALGAILKQLGCEAHA